MTSSTAVSTRRFHRAEGKARTDSHAQQTTEVLIRAAHTVFDNCGVAMAPRKVTRLVHTYKRHVEPNGVAFADFVANSVELNAAQRQRVAEDLHRVISYADPTGETAVNHVMQGATHRE